MLGSRERHVLQEVGATFLLVVLLQRTYLHHQSHLYAMARQSIRHNDIVESVIKVAFHGSPWKVYFRIFVRSCWQTESCKQD